MFINSVLGIKTKNNMCAFIHNQRVSISQCYFRLTLNLGMTFQALTAVLLKIQFSWDVTPCLSVCPDVSKDRK